MIIKHIDLFSGIAGFALAVDQVWPKAEHIFCDNDSFCRQVIKKHYPNSLIYEEIKDITKKRLIADTRAPKQRGLSNKGRKEISKIGEVYLLTGGFPCQPFSQAGKRKGTEDNRYLWPEMLRVIQFTKPKWIIAENVRGLLTLQEGVVFEQVCTDLEDEGYAVQPLIIPAVAVNAPHRRDRIWIVATNTTSNGFKQGKTIKDEKRYAEKSKENRKLEGRSKGSYSDTSNTSNKRLERRSKKGKRLPRQQSGNGSNKRGDWNQNWLEVATKLCRVDDGLPAKLDGFELSKPRHRVERLKALGNAIVPQVAIEIMKAIKENEEKS